MAFCGSMSTALFDALMQSPVLPEIIQDAQRALTLERKLRQKFYQDITPEHKWEFIQGEVIMHSPALHRHLQATNHLFNLMHNYVMIRRCGQAYVEKAMTTFPRNDYEPDIMFFGEAKTGLIDADTLRFPIPDLIVEVLSPSTEKRDRGIKFEDYAFHGVGEYWIIDPVSEAVELYRLDGQVYPMVSAQTEGMLSSDVIPGFEIPTRAIFDKIENLNALRNILASV